MHRHANLPQVGAPDTELRTSPIFDDGDDELLSLDRELESAACYFNGKPYEFGKYVLSGDEVLYCDDRGIWVRKGEAVE